MSERVKYLWISDTHLLPWQRYKFLSCILDIRPQGVFLTGDISHSGFTLIDDLEFIAKRIGRPLYFTMGNHDFWFSSFEKVSNQLTSICKKYPNLVWIDRAGVVPLNDEAALIGQMGWYSADQGNPEYIKYTFDWFMIEDFRKLKTWNQRFELFRELAKKDAEKLANKLEEAIETYKTVYALTHFGGWPEGSRHNSIISEEFWKPYNTNSYLGPALEKVMEKHKKRRLYLFSGHVHSAATLHINRCIEARVGRGSYHKLSEEEILYI